MIAPNSPLFFSASAATRTAAVVILDASSVRSFGGKPLTPFPLSLPLSLPPSLPPGDHLGRHAHGTGCTARNGRRDGGRDGPDDRMIIIFCSLSVAALSLSLSPCCGSNLSQGEKRKEGAGHFSVDEFLHIMQGKYHRNHLSVRSRM